MIMVARPWRIVSCGVYLRRSASVHTRRTRIYDVRADRVDRRRASLDAERTLYRMIFKPHLHFCILRPIVSCLGISLDFSIKVGLCSLSLQFVCLSRGIVHFLVWLSSKRFTRVSVH